MASQDRKAGSFNEIFLRELQDFLLEQTVALGEKLLEESIDQVSAYLFNGILDKKELQTMRTQIKALADELARGELSLDRLPVIMTRALAFAEILGEPYLSEQRRPLAILWTALTASFAIRNATVKANVSVSLVSAGTAATGGHMVYLPSHHGLKLLEEEFTSFFGPDAPDRLDLGQAIDYLICGAGIDRLLVEHLPQLALFFQLLEERLDLTPGDIISGGIEGSIQRDFSTTELYQKVKGFVQETTETFILAQLFPAIRQHVPKTYETRIYMDEVVEPSLLIMSRFAFEKVDLFVKAGVTPDSVLQPLNKGLSAVVCKIMVRNVVVLGDILIMPAVTQLGHGFGQFEQDLRSNRGQAMLDGSFQLLQDLLPMQHLSPQKLKAPVRDLLIALMRAGKKAHGPQVWTRKRRDEFRKRMINLLLSVDGNADYASTDAMDRFFREMAECAFIPNVDELLALHRLCMEILGNEMAIFQTHALPALTKFHLAVSQAAVREMDQAAQKVMRQAARHLDALYRAYLEAQARARKLAQALQQAIAEHTRLLKALTKTFGSAAQRNELLKKIKSDGLKEVERLTKASADYRLLPAPLKKAKVVAARKTFQTAWAVAGPQISLGLKCLNEVAKTLSDLVAKAPNVTALTQNVSKQIEKEVQQAVKKALKVALPPRLSFRGMARSVANAILGNTLIKKQLKDVVAQKAVQRQAAKQHQSGVKTQEQREQRWRAQKSRLDHLKGGPLALVIGSPRSTTVYHKQVKLDITVKGANNSFVDPSTRRILVMLNGSSLPGAGRNWKMDARQKALRLRQTLAFNKRLFRDGVNLIECSVVDGRGRTIRETKAFQLWHV